MEVENDAAINGDEQTSAPVAPAPAEEPAPANAKEAVRRAYEQERTKAAEREEKSRPAVANEGEDTGKPALDRSRDPHGRFLKGEGQSPAPAEKAATEAPEGVQAPKEEPQVGGPLRPPPGWSAAARMQFEKLPPEVREAVAKREAEVNQGFAVLQKYKGLETYTPTIEGSGISHAEFTKRAVEWEQSLKTNPIGTLLHVAKIGGIDIVRVAQMIQQQGGQQNARPPQNQQQSQQYQQQQAANQYPAQHYQQGSPQPQQPQPDINALINQKLAERDAHSSVDDFLSNPKNIHAESVADDMALLIKEGRADGLEQAYEMACWAHPEIRDLLIKERLASASSNGAQNQQQRAANQARSAAKATIGAPAGPPPAKKDAPPATIRDAVRRAYDMAREQA